MKSLEIILVQKKVIRTNKVIRDKSQCANCFSDKSRFVKQKHNKKVVGIISVLNFSYTNYYKTY